MAEPDHEAIYRRIDMADGPLMELRGIFMLERANPNMLREQARSPEHLQTLVERAIEALDQARADRAPF